MQNYITLFPFKQHFGIYNLICELKFTICRTHNAKGAHLELLFFILYTSLSQTTVSLSRATPTSATWQIPYTPLRCKRCHLVLRTTFAKCEPPRSNLHSLADEQARRLASFDYLPARNLMSKYFDTRYLFSLSVTNSLPFAICHLIVRSE